MRGSQTTDHRRGRTKSLGVVLGGLLVVAGLAFHGLAATVHPMVDPQPGWGDEWAFLRWGWLRVLAWAGVLGGTWLAAWGLTARGEPTPEAVGGAT